MLSCMIIPESIYLGSVVVLLVGNGHVHRSTRLCMTPNEWVIACSDLHTRSVTCLASRVNSVGFVCIRREATDTMVQNRRTEVSWY